MIRCYTEPLWTGLVSSSKNADTLDADRTLGALTLKKGLKIEYIPATDGGGEILLTGQIIDAVETNTLSRHLLGYSVSPFTE
jgi:hypothetical protein